MQNQMLSTYQTATEAEALEIAKKVLGSFMQQPSDPRTMLICLKNMLVGLPLITLRRMMDKEVGLAAHEAFFSLSAARDWLDNQTPVPPLKFREPMGKISDAEWRRLRAMNETVPHAPLEARTERFPPKDEIIPLEERERRVAMLKGVARQIRATAKAKCVGRPTLQSKQIDDPKKRLEALVNLEQMKEA